MLDACVGYAAVDAALRTTISLNEPIQYLSCGEEETLSRQDIIADDRPGPEDILYCKELRVLLTKGFWGLTRPQRKITYMYYGKGHTQAEIANRLNISASAVSQALAASVRKLRLSVLPEPDYRAA